MRPRPVRPFEAAFTLADVAVGMALAGVVLLGAYGAYDRAARSAAAWRARVGAASALAVATRRVADDLRRTATLAPADSGLVLLGAVGDTVATYGPARPAATTRDGRPLALAPGVDVRVEGLAAQADAFAARVAVTARGETRTAAVAVRRRPDAVAAWRRLPPPLAP